MATIRIPTDEATVAAGIAASTIDSGDVIHLEDNFDETGLTMKRGTHLDGDGAATTGIITASSGTILTVPTGGTTNIGNTTFKGTNSVSAGIVGAAGGGTINITDAAVSAQTDSITGDDHDVTCTRVFFDSFEFDCIRTTTGDLTLNDCRAVSIMDEALPLSIWALHFIVAAGAGGNTINVNGCYISMIKDSGGNDMPVTFMNLQTNATVNLSNVFGIIDTTSRAGVDAAFVHNSGTSGADVTMHNCGVLVNASGDNYGLYNNGGAGSATVKAIGSNSVQTLTQGSGIAVNGGGSWAVTKAPGPFREWDGGALFNSHKMAI